jgi:hypothetical protein
MSPWIGDTPLGIAALRVSPYAMNVKEIPSELAAIPPDPEDRVTLIAKQYVDERTSINSVLSRNNSLAFSRIYSVACI